MTELLENEILRIQSGSKLYGTDTPTSDDDYMGVFVESPRFLFSGNKSKSVNLHSRGPQEKNVNADDDGVAYPLRHFLKLATDGNPSILCVLFAKPEHVVFASDEGKWILENKSLFVSQKAGPKFLGYMKSQLLRMQGDKKGHVPSRPELVEKYGYDTKYAMQIARLGIQGCEFLKTGNLKLPMDLVSRDILSSIRNGEWTFDDCVNYLSSIETHLKELVNSDLLIPEEPDYCAIWDLSREIHETYWRRTQQ